MKEQPFQVGDLVEVIEETFYLRPNLQKALLDNGMFDSIPLDDKGFRGRVTSMLVDDMGQWMIQIEGSLRPDWYWETDLRLVEKA